MRMRVSLGGLALVLVALLLMLTALAYASPPDPTWNRGLWDDDDFDNVVDFITSTSHLVAVPVLTDLRPVHDLTALSMPRAEDVVAVIPLAVFGPRAPPSA